VDERDLPALRHSAEQSSTASAEAYDRFAQIYNARIAHDFREAVMPVLSDLVLDLLSPSARILDVCCGTGQVTHAIAQRGFRVTGLDSSHEMLRLAKQNAAEADFVRCDVRDLDRERTHCLGDRRFSAAISTFNSFAHLSSAAELRSAFHGIRGCLEDGAPFVFDLSMLEQYWRKWRGSFEIAADGLRCVVAPTFDFHTRIATNHIVLFDESAEPHTESNFDLMQKCHSKQEVTSALAYAGFRHIESFDAEHELAMEGEAGRRFFRAIA
jgi:SAM-dependent methyltransferase